MYKKHHKMIGSNMQVQQFFNIPFCRFTKEFCPHRFFRECYTLWSGFKVFIQKLKQYICYIAKAYKRDCTYKQQYLPYQAKFQTFDTMQKTGSQRISEDSLLLFLQPETTMKYIS